jgi:hypothetical protein
VGLRDVFSKDPRSRVKMVVSVDELPAGEQFDLPVELADRFILRGYAEGILSREYSPEEKAALHANHQVVNV